MCVTGDSCAAAAAAAALARGCLSRCCAVHISIMTDCNHAWMLRLSATFVFRGFPSVVYFYSLVFWRPQLAQVIKQQAHTLCLRVQHRGSDPSPCPSTFNLLLHRFQDSIATDESLPILTVSTALAVTLVAAVLVSYSRMLFYVCEYELVCISARLALSGLSPPKTYSYHLAFRHFFLSLMHPCHRTSLICD